MTQLGCPHANEVVVVSHEEVEVGVEVEGLWRVGSPDIHKVVPGVCASQIDGPQRAVWVLGSIREITWIGRMHLERTFDKVRVANPLSNSTPLRPRMRTSRW